MRMISVCLRPTQLSWLPVLTNVAPFSLRRAAADNMLQIIEAHQDLCMLISLSIHLHGLHTDTQYGQIWHLLTQLRGGERTGRRLLWSTTLL